MDDELRALDGYDAVVEATGLDPQARWGIDPAAPLRGVARGRSVAWNVQRTMHHEHAWTTALGPVHEVAALLVDVLGPGADPDLLGRRPRGITVPHGTIPALPESLRPAEHGDWTWWWTDAAPPVQQHEDRVEPLVDAHDELVAFLAVASPTASASADDPAVESWCGIRGDAGELLACAANRPYVDGIPHLASVATLPDARGRGLGRAVTAWLTRTTMARTGSPVTTLGMYSHNEPARSVYLALGFHPAHRFTSGALPELS